MPGKLVAEVGEHIAAHLLQDLVLPAVMGLRAGDLEDRDLFQILLDDTFEDATHKLNS
jgi:hypothetical protein